MCVCVTDYHKPGGGIGGELCGVGSFTTAGSLGKEIFFPSETTVTSYFVVLLKLFHICLILFPIVPLHNTLTKSLSLSRSVSLSLSVSLSHLQEIFPVYFGPKYDAALEMLVWEFISRLEELLPVPDLTQVPGFS